MSQNQNILNYLKAGYSLTGLDALKLFGTMKLASRISELKAEGHPIINKVEQGENGKHYCRYWYAPKVELPPVEFLERRGQLSFV